MLVARVPGVSATSPAYHNQLTPPLPEKGADSGLGFISPNFGDLFRRLDGDLANKDPLELKPPFRVSRASEEALQVGHYPMGILCVQVRLCGDRFPVDAVVKGEYMKWAVATSLSEALSRIGKVRVRPEAVLFCADEVEVLDVQMPFLGDHLWQFCDFRFDFKVAVRGADEARKLVSNGFHRMVDFEAEFCRFLEYKFRDIYHLTVLRLTNKRSLLLDGQGQTDELDLFLAAQRNDVAGIERLVRKGTDVDASHKATNVLQHLLSEDQRFLYVTLGRTPLLAAAEEGHVDAMRALLSGQADVNGQDAAGFHALYLAAGARDAEGAVSFLLACDADVHLANNAGYTALHNACGSGALGAIAVLLEARADLNRKSASGSAPVHVAVLNHQLGVLEALKRCGGNLDMPAFGGNTPVHEAVMQNSAELVQRLFALNADVNVESGPDNGFATPLRMAQERRKKKALRALVELGALERIEHEGAGGAAPG